jgi:integrase
LAADELIDEEQRHKDYRSGKWGQPDYQTPYKAQSKTTVAGVTEGIVAGRVATTVNPTLMDAMNSYLEEYAEKNIGGNARTIQSQTTNTKRVLAQFASFIEGGRTARGFQREVTSITVAEAMGFRSHLREQHPNSGTADKNLRYPSAVFSHIIEKGQGLYINNHLMRNPFYKLRNKKREEQLAKKKWPLNPEEFRKYEEAAYEAEDHVKLLILFLLYTGCRVSDAYGLEVRDVNLTENIPTMYLRHNGIRRLDKDGIQANIPLVGPLLEALRSYEMSDNPNDPVFPEFANIRSGRDRASAEANKVRKIAGITRDGVTAHSARHSWQDRLDAARVHIAERDYLIAHKTKQSSAVAQAYGSAYPAKNMLENQLAALACEDWGDFRS